MVEQGSTSYTREMARWPRYRFRTWAREHVPGPLARLFPPGSKDCGCHEWFRNDDHTDICLHCTVGEREHVLREIDPESELWEDLTLAAGNGSQACQRIVKKMLAEHAAAQHAA
jgi:hypothetical protein